MRCPPQNPRQRLRRRVIAGKDEAADFRQRGEGIGVCVTVGSASVKSVFVKLKPLLGGGAKDHRAQPAIANGERLSPLGVRLAIPQTEPFATSHQRKRRQQENREA